MLDGVLQRTCAAQSPPIIAGDDGVTRKAVCKLAARHPDLWHLGDLERDGYLIAIIEWREL